VKTDDLITLLSNVHAPVDRRRLDRALIATVALGLVAVLALVLMTIGPRQDLAQAALLPFVTVKHALTLALVAAAALAYREMLRPTGVRQRALLPLLVVAAMGLLAAAQLAVSPVGQWSALVFGQHWLACLVFVPIYAVLPFAAMVWLARQGAPVDLTAAGATAGFLSGALSAAGYAIHCTDDTAPFLFVWYGLAILAVTLVGAVLGPRLMRW
jgi:hypothetical protein